MISVGELLTVAGTFTSDLTLPFDRRNLTSESEYSLDAVFSNFLISADDASFVIATGNATR